MNSYKLSKFYQLQFINVAHKLINFILMSTSGIVKQPIKLAHCIEHKDNFYSCINLAKKNGQQDVKRLLCPECMFKRKSNGETYVDQTDTIPISLVLLILNIGFTKS